LKETFAMSHAKQASKRKRRSKTVPVLGAAGLLSLAGGASAQMIGHPVELPTRGADTSHELMLSDEEVSDVSLATFYVFNKENAGRPGLRLVRGGCGGGGCGGGCGGRCGGCGGGGCGGGCGGRCGGCGVGCRGCGGFGGCGCIIGCVGCGGCGGWWTGGCCLSWGACRLC
jgi:hypothetical protein